VEQAPSFDVLVVGGVDGVGEPFDLLAAAPHFEPSLAFHHPVMQEALIEEAGVAGATVWRPSRLVSLTPGGPPTAEVMVDGVVRTVTARLVVGADGRDSQVVRLGGFERHADPTSCWRRGCWCEARWTQGTRSIWVLTRCRCAG
jgi:2-polyprenyl-6-methoxyphenol hydroxylase-like FAD-dependent oxidoreductase